MKTKNQDLNGNEERERRSEKRWNRFYFGLSLAGALLTLYALNGVCDSRKARAELMTKHPAEYKEYINARENYSKVRSLFKGDLSPNYKSVEDLINNSRIDITSIQKEYNELFSDIINDSEGVKKKIEALKGETEKRLEEKTEPIKCQLKKAERENFFSLSLGLTFLFGSGLYSAFVRASRRENK